MKGLLYSILFLFLFNTLWAQDNAPKNSIIVESNFIAMTSIAYNRIVPLKKVKLLFGGGYIMGTGFGFGSHWAKAETGILIFGPKHFLEAGAMFVYGFNSDSSPGFKLAYRFQSKIGLTFTLCANAFLNIDPIFLPSLGVGYSF